MRLALVVLIIVVVVTGGIFYFFYARTHSALGGQRKQDALVAILGREPRVQAAATRDQGWTTHHGKRFSISYPAAAIIYDRENKNIEQNKRLLEFWRADVVEPRLTMTVQVLQKPESSTFTEFPAVALRQRDSSYAQCDLTLDGKAGLAFTHPPGDLGMYEQTGFVEYGGAIYVISVQGSQEAKTQAVFDHVADSFRFAI